MASIDLHNFKHEGMKVRVFTGQSSSDVYFTVGSGSKRYSGLTFNSESGWFKRSGALISFDEAEAHIRGQI
jgi:hypothetical protein